MTKAFDSAAGLIQGARSLAAAARYRGPGPVPSHPGQCLECSQDGERLRLRATASRSLPPQRLTVWAHDMELADFPVRVEAIPGQRESVSLTTALPLADVLDAWTGSIRADAPEDGDDDGTEERRDASGPRPVASDPRPVDSSGPRPADAAPNTDPERVPGFAMLAWRYTGTAADVPEGASRILVPGHAEPLTRTALRLLLEDGSLAPTTPLTYHRNVGRYGSTHIGILPGMSGARGSVRPFVNRKGQLALAINRPLKPRMEIRVDRISATQGILALSGGALSRHSRVMAARLLVVSRKTGEAFSGSAGFDLDAARTAADFGRGHYSWQARLDFSDIDWSQLDNADNYDLWLELSLAEAEEPHRARINRTPYAVRATTRSGVVTRGGRSLVVNPYYTFKAKATSLILEVADARAFAALEAFNPALDALARRSRKPIWLVGELAYKAQDNGLHFFRYLRENHPEIDAYYVINADSPELKNLAGLDHVIHFGTREHFEIALRADRFIGTHHADYLFPTRHPDFKRKAHGAKVFLQHGVMGTKWMVPNYGKRSAGFSTDLFLVSSAREQEYIVKDFGYDIEETAITGLPRFDALFAGDVETHERQLLVIPTWRDWLQSPEAFAASEYLQQWGSFLHSPELAALVQETGLEVVFCLHPNMQRFRDYFAGAPARIVSQGEIDVQTLMKQSAAMVTDYSSVGFDFSFLGRPVLYYQFDRDRFLGKAGSHLDLDRELPGEITTTLPGLLARLDAAAARGFTMTAESRRRSERFLLARDRDNCDRVFNAIAAAKAKRGPVATLGSSEFVERAENKLRRSRYYFPAMKAMQRLVQRLPMQPGLMVFESGLGKQYADSPRYLYEELVRRGDTRPKVWIYAGRHSFTDPHTRTVKRLSPSYFWHLARAQYWITNQNLPHYMTRRPKATYLQTWHGTPLKHMLHDIGQIHGRDEGYMERVDRAISQWTHLLSPSPFATGAMRSAFRYEGPVVEEGYPRNDVFFGDDVQERTSAVRSRLGLPEGAKVVLYAPTFRDNDSTGRGRFTFRMPFDLAEFDRRFGADAVLLLRMHVLVSSAVSIPRELRGRIIDVSGYPEIQELYLVSDVLVTDYSSVFFDFAVLRRPIVFYAYDLELYRDTLRGFYLDYLNDLPGPVVQTEAELHEALGRALHGDTQDAGRYADFVERFAPKDDGAASRRVVDAVLGGAVTRGIGPATRASGGLGVGRSRAKM